MRNADRHQSARVEVALHSARTNRHDAHELHGPKSTRQGSPEDRPSVACDLDRIFADKAEDLSRCGTGDLARQRPLDTGAGDIGPRRPGKTKTRSVGDVDAVSLPGTGRLGQRDLRFRRWPGAARPDQSVAERTKAARAASPARSPAGEREISCLTSPIRPEVPHRRAPCVKYRGQRVPHRVSDRQLLDGCQLRELAAVRDLDDRRALRAEELQRHLGTCKPSVETRTYAG
ncbi:MAG: hypothetical protein JWR89_5100 [Tardiphaga sp.]|nr:hypothetical protein [Tardiphaga sp.]